MRQARRGFEPRSTDSESVVLTATPTSQSWTYIGAWYTLAPTRTILTKIAVYHFFLLAGM